MKYEYNTTGFWNYSHTFKSVLEERIREGWHPYLMSESQSMEEEIHWTIIFRREIKEEEKK